MCEMPSCYGVEDRKARIAHTCYECKGSIKPGETYHYHHGVWDGVGDSFKVCVDCEALRVTCDDGREYDEKTPFGGLYESVMESNDLTFINRLIEIKTRRGAAIPVQMADRVSRIVERDKRCAEFAKRVLEIHSEQSR